MRSHFDRASPARSTRVPRRHDGRGEGAGPCEGARAVEAGRIADLVGYRLDGISFTPLNNPLGQLVYSAGRNEVDLVMVGGQVIEQGKLTRIDENAISTRSMPRTSASNRC
jgi:hypothetical protein